MIKAASAAYIFALAAGLAAGQSNETDPPFRAADPAASPAIAKILRELESNRAAAADLFWQDLRKDSSPLIEAVPGDRQSSLVSSLGRESGGRLLGRYFNEGLRNAK